MISLVSKIEINKEQRFQMTNRNGLQVIDVLLIKRIQQRKNLQRSSINLDMNN